MKKHKLIVLLKIVIGVPVLLFVLGYVTMTLWNWLIPALFNGPQITLLQTFGIVLLSKILFGGFKGKGCCCNNSQQSWKERMKAKWDTLSSEERSSLKNRFFEKCYSKKNNTDSFDTNN